MIKSQWQIQSFGHVLILWSTQTWIKVWLTFISTRGEDLSLPLSNPSHPGLRRLGTDWLIYRQSSISTMPPDPRTGTTLVQHTQRANPPGSETRTRTLFSRRPSRPSRTSLTSGKLLDGPSTNLTGPGRRGKPKLHLHHQNATRGEAVLQPLHGRDALADRPGAGRGSEGGDI